MSRKKRGGPPKKHPTRPPAIQQTVRSTTVTPPAIQQTVSLTIVTPAIVQRGEMGREIITSGERTILPIAASVSSDPVTVSPAGTDLTVAHPVVATVSPANTGGAIRNNDQANRQPAARRLVWSGNEPAGEDESESGEIPNPENIQQVTEENPAPEIHQPESYARAAKGNRLATNGILLDYVAPLMDDEGVFVELDKEDVEAETGKWKQSLVLYVVGADHTMGYLEQAISKLWGDFAVPTLHQYDNSFFIARFDSQDECDLILDNGPYFIKNQPMVLKQWTPQFEFKEYQLTKLLVWVKLPQLPLGYRSKKSLNMIASMLGKPLHSDECTLKQNKVGFVRVLVELDVSQPVMKSVRIKVSGGEPHVQIVEYENLPEFCHQCQCIGHVCDVPQAPAENIVPDRQRRRRRVRNRNPPVEQWVQVRRTGPAVAEVPRAQPETVHANQFESIANVNADATQQVMAPSENISNVNVETTQQG
ncbi:hypothetical protein OROHE_025100 [Orobanche hederae]